MRRAPLVAVHVWSEPLYEVFDMDLYEFGHPRSIAARTLSEALGGYGEKYPDVPMSTELVGGLEPGLPLIEQSRDSALIVVGSGSRSVIAGRVLGSMGHVLIHRAHCPVAVVHPSAEHS